MNAAASAPSTATPYSVAPATGCGFEPAAGFAPEGDPVLEVVAEEVAGRHEVGDAPRGRVSVSGAQ